MSDRLISVVVSLVLLGLAARAPAVTVRTLDGGFHEGDVRLENGALVVRPTVPGSAPVKVALADLMSADFRVPAAAPAATVVTPRWSARDVGTVATPGTTRFNNGVVTIRAAGTGLGGAADAGQFVMQPLSGDGQIVARLTSLSQSHTMARAAIMFRASLDPAAPAVAMAFQAAGNSAFQYRPRPGANTTIREGGATELPVYMKLARRENTFTAYLSTDGESWSSVASQDVTLPASAFVGLAVSSNTQQAVTTATFENVSVTRTLSLTAAAGAGGGASRGVVLRNGSVLTGDVRGVNGTAVTLSRPREPNLSVPLAHVSWVFLAPLTADVVSRLPEDREGVLLSNGDFVEGRLLDLNDSRVKLSSVLFGIQRFEVRSVAVVACPGAAVAARSRFHLRAADGSSLLFDDAELAVEGIRVKDPALGTLTFPLTEVADFGAGPGRITSLTSLKPEIVKAKGEGLTYAVNSSLSGGPLALADRVVEEGLALREGARLGYRLEERYRSLSLRVAAAREAVASDAVSLNITVDGKTAYEGNPVKSSERPVVVYLDLTGVRQLEISLEGQGPGILIAPMLVLNGRAD
jgi:hypothetical protein